MTARITVIVGGGLGLLLLAPEQAWAVPIAPPGIGPRIDGSTLLGLLVGIMYGIIPLAVASGVYRKREGRDLPGGYTAAGLLAAIFGGGAFGYWAAGHAPILGALTGALVGATAVAIAAKSLTSNQLLTTLIAAAISGAALGGWLAS